MGGLPLAGGTPRHHHAGPPGEALDLPPHQLPDAEALVVMTTGREEEEEEEEPVSTVITAL